MVRKITSIKESLNLKCSFTERMDSTANNLEDRPCPLCTSQNKIVLFNLSMSKVFKVNPTYNEAWFNENNISPDFEFPIVKCKECGFVFSKFKMKDEIAFRYYNEGINEQKSKEKIFNKGKRTFFIEIWGKLNLISEKQRTVKVLDFGAGWGDFLAIAKSPGVEVFGLEFDKRKIEFAQSLGVCTGNMEFIRENAPYDIFICNQVLEHLNHPKEALKELKSLLNSGSVGFISVPNFDEPIMHQQSSLLKKGLLARKDVDPLGHLNYFTPQNLRKVVFEAGFKEIKFNATQKSIKSNLFSFYRNLKGSPKEKPGTSIYVKAI